MNEINEEQIKKFHEVLHCIYRNFKKINSDMSTELFHGITTIELSIIGVIGSNPDIKLKDICRKLQLSASTLTSAIDRMEKRKILKRVISKNDRRSFALQLTKEGKSLFSMHEEAEKKIFTRVLGALKDDEERENFIDSLEKISKEF